ncbi:MAG: ECF-type sigma factor [Gemmatimonadales bacterium]
MIRRVLVDHARAHDAAKRGGGARKVSLTDSVGASEGPDIELLCLDAALFRFPHHVQRVGDDV